MKYTHFKIAVLSIMGLAALGCWDVPSTTHNEYMSIVGVVTDGSAPILEAEVAVVPASFERVMTPVERGGALAGMVTYEGYEADFLKVGSHGGFSFSGLDLASKYRVIVRLDEESWEKEFATNVVAGGICRIEIVIKQNNISVDHPE